MKYVVESKGLDCTKRSYNIQYPDGGWRLMTQPKWVWDQIDELISHGYEFHDFLSGSIRLANEFPSRHGWEWDVRDNFPQMVKTCYRNLQEDLRLPSNQNNRTYS